MLGGARNTQVDPCQCGFALATRRDPGAGRGACQLADAGDDTQHVITVVNVEGPYLMRFLEAIVIDHRPGFAVQRADPDQHDAAPVATLPQYSGNGTNSSSNALEQDIEPGHQLTCRGRLLCRAQVLLAQQSMQRTHPELIHCWMLAR